MSDRLGCIEHLSPDIKQLAPPAELLRAVLSILDLTLGRMPGCVDCLEIQLVPPHGNPKLSFRYGPVPVVDRYLNR